MDLKKFAIILAGVVLVAFGIGMISLRVNDNLGPMSIDGRSSLNVRSNGSNVRIGWDGIDVKDGDDHVQVGWDGIKVKDGEDEVNVGWNGVKIKEGSDIKFDLFDVGSWFGLGHRNLTTTNVNEQRNVDLTGFNNLKIGSRFIDVKIISEDREDLYINYHGRLRSNVVPILEVEENGDILNIELSSIGNSYTITESNVVLEITLPKSFNGDVKAESSSGDITIMNIAGGNLDIDASSGDINLNNLEGEEIDIETSSGNIYLKNITGTDFYIDASSGDISLHTLNGNKMVVETSSGDISANDSIVKGAELTASSGYIKIHNFNSNKTFIKTNSGNITTKESTGDFTLSASSGDVDISLPHDANYTIKGSSSSGRYTPSRDLDVRINNKGDFEAHIGNGENTINITTSSGDVRFR